MKNFLNFLNRNLTKIIWMLAILVWVGVGVYYCSTNPSCYFTFLTLQTSINNKVLDPISQKINPPTPTPTPTFLEKLNEVEFIEGNFVKWEVTEDSPDRYLLLTDSQTKQSFPKIRVGFEFSTLYSYQGDKNITVFAVQKSEEEYDVLYALKFFTDNEIDKLIKKGDWIKIYFKRKLEKEENVKDDKGTLLAHWLIIKREGGKAEVEKEIGREIREPEIPNL